MTRPATKLLRHAERVKIKGSRGSSGPAFRQRLQKTPKSIRWSKKDGAKFVGA